CCFFQAEDGIRDATVTGVQTCALPISMLGRPWTSCAGSDAVRSRTISSRISPASSVCPALIAARHAYVAANRSKRFCQPPNRPRSEERRVGERRRQQVKEARVDSERAK